MKSIVHVIDNLGRGGAETLLTDLLPQLSQHYKIILVTLTDKNEFGEDVYQHCYQHYCLQHHSRLAIPRTVKKLKAIIEKYSPVLVRSQLFWSSIITKMACPKRIPLVFSVHITMEVFHETILGPVLAMIEKATLSSKYTMIGVTREVVESYQRKFHFKGTSFVLYNYVRKQFFIEQAPLPRQGLKLLAVGNLRPQKNYQYLIDAFKKLKGKDVSLHIYGDGLQYQSLAEQIRQHDLAIELKGKASNVPQIMTQYHAFVMASSFEGFGIVVAEAMAAGLPLILSDIPVLREVSESRAFFVDLKNTESFVQLVNNFLEEKMDVNVHVEENKLAAKKKYTQEVYLQKLLQIYDEAIAASIKK